MSGKRAKFLKKYAVKMNMNYRVVKNLFKRGLLTLYTEPFGLIAAPHKLEESLK